MKRIKKTLKNGRFFLKAKVKNIDLDHTYINKGQNMFTLRRITSQNNQSNNFLGDSYSLIHQETNEDDYKKTLKSYLGLDHDDDIYGFILYESGSAIIPLYKKSKYFIMVNGATVDKISFTT